MSEYFKLTILLKCQVVIVDKIIVKPNNCKFDEENARKMISFLNKHGYNPVKIGPEPVCTVELDEGVRATFKANVITYTVNGNEIKVTPIRTTSNEYLVNINGNVQRICKEKILDMFDNF